MKRFIFCFSIMVLILFVSCKQKSTVHEHHEEAKTEVYTCAMHPQIIKYAPGNCPICGMELIKKSTNDTAIADIDLHTLLQPTNAFVISSIAVTTIKQQDLPIEINAFGSIAYDTRQTGSIPARVSGRIEKLYVRYQYQKITKGQRIMDIYSPELMTQQQNLLFLIKSDPANSSIINSAKQRLLFLGLTDRQVEQLIQSGKPFFSLPVFSHYSGHLHEAIQNNENVQPMPPAMGNVPKTTGELSIREGMYIQKGMTVFTIYNPSKAWAVLNVYADKQSLVKTGDAVKIIPETDPTNTFRSTVSFIEPFYRPETKTVTVRVAFNNSTRQLPVGSKVSATIYSFSKNDLWLPKESVLALGREKIVFLKQQNGFKPHKIETGLAYENSIQVRKGLSPQDSVAANAQFLMDSESFIKINDKP